MKLRHLLIATAVLICGGGTAHAYTFTFADECLNQSGHAFSQCSAFTGATGSAPASAIYQETTAGASPVITRLTTGITGGFIPGEFVQGTNPTSALVTNGWQATLAFNAPIGVPPGSLFNQNGATPFFRYDTGITISGGSAIGFPGGTTTVFNFNSIDLKFNGVGTAPVTLEAFLGGSVTPVDTKTITLTNSFQTFTENWANVDTIEICPGSAPPCSNFGASNAISTTNVRINDPLPVPEPMTLALLGTGLFGLGVARRWRRR